MGISSMNYNPMMHDENASYHDHDAATPLMTDSIDKNSVNDPPLYTASDSCSDPENGIPLGTVSSPIRDNLAVADHRHCDTCLQQQERRERRTQQKSCCRWVAVVFIVLIVCAAAIGIVAVVLH